MLIDNIISLTYATLQSDPSVSECYDIIFQSTDVRRGDLFVVQETKEIDTALKNGAYALLYDSDVNICDEEIAWIKVESVENAVKKILRHLLLQHSIPIVSCQSVCLDVIQTLSADERLIVIKESSFEIMYKAIQKITSRSIVMIDETLLSTGIFPTCKSFTATHNSDFKVIESSLFHSTLLLHGIYYDHLRISGLMLPYLQEALNFFQYYNLNNNIAKVSSIPHFEPVFLSKTLKIKEYGSSERVVILEKERLLFQKAVAFLLERAPWSKIVILVPKDTDIIKYDNIDYQTFNTSDDLMQSLISLEFNFALVHYDSSLKDRFNEEHHLQQLIFAL